MADTSKYTAYKNKFQKENYDRINLVVSKGKKDEIKSFAELHGESLNSFVNKAIDEKMQRETEEPRSV